MIDIHIRAYCRTEYKEQWTGCCSGGYNWLDGSDICFGAVMVAYGCVMTRGEKFHNVGYWMSPIKMKKFQNSCHNLLKIFFGH